MPRGQRRQAKQQQQTGDTTRPELEDLGSGPVTGHDPVHVGNFENHLLENQFPGQQAQADDTPEEEQDAAAASAEAGDQDFESDPEDEDPEDIEAAGAGEEDIDGEPPGSDSPPESDDDLATLRQNQERLLGRIEAQDRELEFLRRGAGVPQAGQPAQQPQQPQEFQLPFDITEHDIAALTQGGPAAVQIFKRALQLTAQAVHQHTTGVLVNAYEQNESARAEGASTIEQFRAQNPDLMPFSEVLQGQANRIWAEMPHASTETKMRELNVRTRERLRQLGISTQATGRGTKRGKTASKRAAAHPTIPDSQRNRVRPAHAEMGGRGKPNGAARLTPKQREMNELLEFQD